MFNELSSYYALAYQQTDLADGRLRRLDVQVTRPDAVVVSSRQVLAPSTAAPAASRGRSDVSRTGLFAALESPLSMGALPLPLATLPVAVSGGRDHAVALTLGLPQVSAAEQFRVRLLVFDGEGRREIVDTARVVDIARATDTDGTELAMRVSLRPGRYNVRVGALLRVHQTANRVVPITVVTSITNAMGGVLTTQSQVIESVAFKGGVADHRFELPLADLAPGAYLLRFIATAGAISAQRDVRFAMR